MKGRALTFCVSGMLWNRSLVMLDKETKSLWSHILGKAMQGELEGTQLETLPSDMVTWETWLREHPKTTVLDLPRTRREYTKEFYRRPANFVFGWIANGKPYYCSFDVLHKRQLLNLKLDKSALLVAFDPGSTSTHLFSRQLDGRELSFVAQKKAQMRDEQTNSVWNRNTGSAIEGQLKGKRLEQRIGIVSYRRAWRIFHPDSQQIGAASDSLEEGMNP